MNVYLIICGIGSKNLPINQFSEFSLAAQFHIIHRTILEDKNITHLLCDENRNLYYKDPRIKCHSCRQTSFPFFFK